MPRSRFLVSSPPPLKFLQDATYMHCTHQTIALNPAQARSMIESDPADLRFVNAGTRGIYLDIAKKRRVESSRVVPPYAIRFVNQGSNPQASGERAEGDSRRSSFISRREQDSGCIAGREEERKREGDRNVLPCGQLTGVGQAEVLDRVKSAASQGRPLLQEVC
eukprot:767773-Hanusia_phi.AAC.2